nr:hypothetical protein [Nitrincola alkalilacustris]
MKYLSFKVDAALMIFRSTRWFWTLLNFVQGGITGRIQQWRNLALIQAVLVAEQLSPSGLRYRATKIIALTFGAPKLLHCRYLARQLKPLGDYIGANRLGDDDNRLNNRLSVGAIVQLANKAFIDFDFVEKVVT